MFSTIILVQNEMSKFYLEVCPIHCSAILESVESIPLHKRGDLPVVLLPCETKLVSMIDNGSAILECPTGLDFGVEVDWSIQVRGVFKDESIPPVTLFLIEGPILNSMLDGEVMIGEQLMGELNTVLFGRPEVCVSIHDFNGTDFATDLCMP